MELPGQCRRVNFRNNTESDLPGILATGPTVCGRSEPSELLYPGSQCLNLESSCIL
jgi:hypothetical protein